MFPLELEPPFIGDLQLLRLTTGGYISLFGGAGLKIELPWKPNSVARLKFELKHLQQIQPVIRG